MRHKLAPFSKTEPSVRRFSLLLLLLRGSHKHQLHGAFIMTRQDSRERMGVGKATTVRFYRIRSNVNPLLGLQ